VSIGRRSAPQRQVPEVERPGGDSAHGPDRRQQQGERVERGTARAHRQRESEQHRTERQNDRDDDAAPAEVVVRLAVVARYFVEQRLPRHPLDPLPRTAHEGARSSRSLSANASRTASS
jgi:hypothetical protein